MAMPTRLADAVLPPTCLACGIPVAGEGSLCASCWNGLTLIERPFCDRLAIPFSYDIGEGALSAEAIADPPPFDRLRAVALFDGVARELVHALKYRDHVELVQWMAGWMRRVGGDVIVNADVIVPVPLHWRRLWWRRFNQAAALATEIGAQTERDVSLQSLQRIRPTGRQVGQSRNARNANVRGAFKVDPQRRIEIAGRRVLVIDDVCTTGATLGAVTKALRRCGASSVDALVFARVAPGAL
jgi:ComF family protein